MKKLKNLFKKIRDEKGIGVVEMVLILVVLVGLVIIFKAQIWNLLGQLFERITYQSGSI